MSPLLPSDLSYLRSLESRLSSQTNELEDRHLAAAIDAQIRACPDEKKDGDEKEDGADEGGAAIDEDANPDAVPNCLSPFVPATAEQLGMFIGYLRSRGRGRSSDSGGDVLLDLGAGDGRVCVASAKLGLVRHAMGLDVSPICVDAARVLAFREGVFGPPPVVEDTHGNATGLGATAAPEGRCEFHRVDLTALPALLLDNPHLLSERISTANVVYIYAYPPLLKRIVPLLAKLTEGNAQSGDSNSTPNRLPVEIITLVYHLPNHNTTLGHVRAIPGTDLRAYDRIVADERVGDVEDNSVASLPPPPEPVDEERFDRSFARSSIRHAMPR